MQFNELKKKNSILLYSQRICFYLVQHLIRMVDWIHDNLFDQSKIEMFNCKQWLQFIEGELNNIVYMSGLHIVVWFNIIWLVFVEYIKLYTLSGCLSQQSYNEHACKVSIVYYIKYNFLYLKYILKHNSYTYNLFIRKSVFKV